VFGRMPTSSKEEGGPSLNAYTCTISREIGRVAGKRCREGEEEGEKGRRGDGEKESASRRGQREGVEYLNEGVRSTNGHTVDPWGS
jgi:hypothetical protein